MKLAPSLKRRGRKSQDGDEGLGGEKVKKQDVTPGVCGIAAASRARSGMGGGSGRVKLGAWMEVEGERMVLHSSLPSHTLRYVLPYTPPGHPPHVAEER